MRSFIEFMLTPEAGAAAAAISTTYLSPHVAIDTTSYSEGLQRIQGEALQSALESDGFRFDASGLMPFEVGAGSFWTGMVDYVTGGESSLDAVLAAIDASWPTE